jgi:hypothetical protein
MNFQALTTTEKNALINTAIVANLNAGMDIVAAVDAVMGAGSYKRIAGMVYDSLRAAQGL